MLCIFWLRVRANQNATGFAPISPASPDSGLPDIFRKRRTSERANTRSWRWIQEYSAQTKQVNLSFSAWGTHRGVTTAQAVVLYLIEKEMFAVKPLKTNIMFNLKKIVGVWECFPLISTDTKTICYFVNNLGFNSCV